MSAYMCVLVLVEYVAARIIFLFASVHSLLFTSPFAACTVSEAKSYSSGCLVESCNTGWTVSDDKSTCEENICSCDNGVASSGAKCPSNEANKCESCKNGFKLSVDNEACEGRCVCMYVCMYVAIALW